MPFLSFFQESRGSVGFVNVDKTDTSFGLPKNIKRGILSVLFQKLRVGEKIILDEKKMVGRFRKTQIRAFCRFFQKSCGSEKKLFFDSKKIFGRFFFFFLSVEKLLKIVGSIFVAFLSHFCRIFVARRLPHFREIVFSFFVKFCFHFLSVWIRPVWNLLKKITAFRSNF